MDGWMDKQKEKPKQIDSMLGNATVSTISQCSHSVLMDVSSVLLLSSCQMHYLQEGLGKSTTQIWQLPEGGKVPILLSIEKPVWEVLNILTVTLFLSQYVGATDMRQPMVTGYDNSNHIFTTNFIRLSSPWHKTSETKYQQTESKGEEMTEQLLSTNCSSGELGFDS